MAPSARTVSVIVLCGVTAAAGASLLSGAHWLGQPIIYVPAGNWVAWTFLASLNAIAFFVTAATVWLRWPARVMLGLAMVWYPVSVALMGNLGLSGGKAAAGSVWTGYTVLLIVGPMLIMVTQSIRALCVRTGRRVG